MSLNMGMLWLKKHNILLINDFLFFISTIIVFFTSVKHLFLANLVDHLLVKNVQISSHFLWSTWVASGVISHVVSLFS